MKESDVVAAGDTLCTISAMKMEVKVTAPVAAKVSKICGNVGDKVVEGALLMVLAPE